MNIFKVSRMDDKKIYIFFSIPHLFERGFPDVENFSLQRKDAVAIPAHDS